MNIIEALQWRYAVRRFSSERLDERRVEELLEAARLSASSYGLQPYRLIVVKDVAMRRQLLPYAMGQNKVENCSHLVVLAAQKVIDDKLVDQFIDVVAKTRGLPVHELRAFSDHIKQAFSCMNNSQKREWAHQQAYLALGTLLTAAAVLKIDTCPMSGFERDGFDRVLGLQELGLESSVICALGLRHPEDDYARSPKVRYGRSELVMSV